MTASVPTSTDEPDGVATHAVALYDSADDLRRRALPFLRDGLASGGSTVAIVSDNTARQLRDALGADQREVRWQVPEVGYEGLGGVFEGVRRFLAGEHEAGNEVRLLTENDGTGAIARTSSYLRFEAASNDVLTPFGFPWTCLYDRRRHPADVLERVREVHPHVVGPCGHTSSSSAYVRPTNYLEAHPGPLSVVPPQPALDLPLASAHQLVEVRSTAVGAGRALGLTDEDGDDFELATAEVLTNAIRHGQQPCRVRLWATPGHVVLRVDDRGDGGEIPTRGFHPPTPSRGCRGGMGIWMVRQLADAVQVQTGDAGTSVELQFPRRA